MNCVVRGREKFCIVVDTGGLDPDDGVNKLAATEYLVHQHLEVMRLIVVDSDPNTAVLRQQIAQEHQPGIHHREPLAVFELVVVVLESALGVVGRVDEDALHTSRIERDQGFQRKQVVALDEEIFVGTGEVAMHRLQLQQVVRHIAGGFFFGLILVDPIEKRHSSLFPQLRCWM